MVNFSNLSQPNGSKFREDLSLDDSAKTAFYWSCRHPLILRIQNDNDDLLKHLS